MAFPLLWALSRTLVLPSSTKTVISLEKPILIQNGFQIRIPRQFLHKKRLKYNFLFFVKFRGCFVSFHVKIQ